MRELLDVDMFVNWVSMLRGDVDGAIVLVDSDSEGQFYENCTHQSARVVPSPNAALHLLQQVQARRVAGVVAAITGAVQAEQLPDSVFQPAVGDVASMLLASASCEKVMEEVGGSSWLRACSKEVGSLLDRAVLLAWTIQNTFGNPVTQSEGTRFDLIAAIDWSTLCLKQDKSDGESSVRPTECDTTVDRRVLLAKCDAVLAAEILAQCTERFQPRGLRSKQQCSADDLLSMMRLSFDIADIESDAIYWQMRAWERTNIQYPLLRQWRILDPLQVVLDQRYWESDLRVMLESACSEGGTVALKLDLDNFKQVNEKLGHTAGDAAIRLACLITKEVFGAVGEVYRRGGDEIVALSPGLGEADATELAEKLRVVLAERFVHWGAAQGLAPTPTASIGLIYAPYGSESDAVKKLLDDAQSRAKQEGKNRVVCSSCISH